MGQLHLGNALRRPLFRTFVVRHLADVPAQSPEPVSTHRQRTVMVLLLAAACFSLATALQPRATAWSSRGDSGSILKVLLGDGLRLFADYFFEKSDVYFHSGYYPSIFDR